MQGKPWDSWIYVFSKFTPEALIFEVLFVLILLTLYSAYWVLRKRKHGVLHHFSSVPPNVVKDYLSALMMDAEQMRAQLFGLLGSAGTPGPTAHLARPTGDFSAALAALEAKMAEQTKAMEAMLAEKAKLEQELAALKLSGAVGGSSGGDNSALNDKIKQLESRLAEYSVIEDDLANLKRLQQENKTLKAQLAGGAGAAVAATAAVASPAGPAPETAPSAPEPTPASETAAAEPSFEGMVDQVEQQLTPDAPTEVPAEAPAAEAPPLDEAAIEATAPPEEVTAPAEAAAAAAEPTPPPAAEAAAAPAGDDDLVAEFEKMLSG